MAERKTGAGLHLAGVLERSNPTPPEPAPVAAEVDPTEAEPKGRGATTRRAPAKPVAAKRIKGRTVYIPDDLFERVIVQAHRRGKTISDYVVAILERQVPDHRTRAAGEDVDAA